MSCERELVCFEVDYIHVHMHVIGVNTRDVVKVFRLVSILEVVNLVTLKLQRRVTYEVAHLEPTLKNRRFQMGLPIFLGFILYRYPSSPGSVMVEVGGPQHQSSGFLAPQLSGYHTLNNFNTAESNR